MAKYTLRQSKLLVCSLAFVTMQGGCFSSCAEEYDCEEDPGRLIELDDLDATMLLDYPVENFLSTIESPMPAVAGHDDRLFESNTDLEEGLGEDVEMTLVLEREGTYYDRQGTFCDEQVAEFLVEVVVRSGDQLLFSGKTHLEIVSPTFGKQLVRMDEFEDRELLALFGISEDQAAPVGDQNHDAFLDVFAKDGEISHVRLEVGNDSTTTGNTTPLLEVLYQQ